MFQVMKKCCKECLFTPGKIVGEKRKQDILDQCKKEDSYFICHKSSLYGDGKGCCRGFYELQPNTYAKVAGRLGFVEFIDIPGPKA